MGMKLTHEETVKRRAAVIAKANKVLESVTIMKEHCFFDEKVFDNGGFERMVEKLCKDNGVSFNDVCRIGEYKFDKLALK